MAKGKKNDKSASHETVIENRRARFDYAIHDTLECGMMLKGSEVKSIRDGKASLQEGYVRIEWGALRGKAPAGKGGKPAPGRGYEPGLYLHGINIGEYPPAGRTGSSAQHRPTRVRTLLAHTRELAKLAREVQVKGCTLVPLKIYFKNGKAKLLVGVGKGKAHQDKRESIAKRESDRDMARAMSRRA